MTVFKNNLIKITILLIGLINPMLFIIKSPLVFETRKIPLSPLPLVFDQPEGITPWGDLYTINFYLQDKIVTINSSDQVAKERRGWARHIIYHTLLALNTQTRTQLTEKLENNFYCLIMYSFLYKNSNEKVYKVSIVRKNPLSKEEKLSEFLCK